jgi:hypothetical protein
MTMTGYLEGQLFPVNNLSGERVYDTARPLASVGELAKGQLVYVILQSQLDPLSPQTYPESVYEIDPTQDLIVLDVWQIGEIRAEAEEIVVTSRLAPTRFKAKVIKLGQLQHLYPLVVVGKINPRGLVNPANGMMLIWEGKLLEFRQRQFYRGQLRSSGVVFGQAVLTPTLIEAAVIHYGGVKGWNRGSDYVAPPPVVII